MPLEGDPGAVLADVAAIPTPAKEDPADTAAPEVQSVSTATATLRSSFSFPRRLA